ncbi:DUF992 domain-containing protein [Daeguia caeni]|uniref:DUF992 domain-containing protein n=1 Tax=Daeguia caeni TaxID=439612 RepID=A0ABV9H4W4_9HYPH
MSRRSSKSLLSAVALISGLGVTVPAIAADRVAPPASARVQPYSQVGTLVCAIEPAIGVILGSQQDLNCEFRPANKRNPVEHYSGTFTKIGVDLGFTNGGTIAWAVWAPSVRPEGALKGNYAGASANAAIGIGGGTNVLTGGSWKTVSLQPISLQGQRGLAAAVGVSHLKLNYEG